MRARCFLYSASACWGFGVSYSLAFKSFIALLLPLTLVWKLGVAADDSVELKERLVEFLVDHQFNVAALEKWIDPMPGIHATTGRCRMLVMNVSPDGWQRDVIRGHAEATDRVFFIFRGKVYSDQPVWLAVAAGFWSRLLRRLGLRQHGMPVIAVIAPEFCNAEQLPWDQLYERGVL
jgi:hypothetical protein